MALDDTVENAKAIAEHTKEASESAADYSTYMEQAKPTTEAVGEAAKKSAEAMERMAGAAGDMISKLIDSGGGAAKVALTLEPMVNVLDRSRKVFGDLGESSKNSANEIKESMGALDPILGHTGKFVKETFGRMVESADKAKILEANLLKTAAATGQLGSFLVESGDDFSRISDRTATYTKLIGDTAEATNRTGQSVAAFAEQLAKIPEALDTDVMLAGGESMSTLEASMKLATGTGMEYTDVVGGMNDAFKLFGQRGEDALDYVNRISVASQQLKIPMDATRKMTEDTARQFKFLGDNTEGALEVLGGFNKALQGSGLGYQTIQEMASGALSSIEKMGTAQQAFLSQQTGGPGGLQGAFQVELELQRGDTTSVMRRVEEALRQQMGGNLVTTEQAAQSQAAAAQMQRQISFLTQGPTAITQDRRAAAQLASAMAEGQLTGMKEILATPQERLRESIERGTSFQESQASQITKIAATLDRTLMVESLQLRAMEKQVFGVESGFSRAILDSMRLGTQGGRNVQTLTGQRGAGGSTVAEQTENIANDFKEAWDASKNILGVAKGAIKEKIREAQVAGANPNLIKAFGALLGMSQTETAPALAEKTAMADLAPPTAPKTMTMEEIGRQAAAGVTESAAEAGKQEIDLNINVTRDGEELTKQKIQFLIDNNDKRKQTEDLVIPYLGTNP